MYYIITTFKIYGEKVDIYHSQYNTEFVKNFVDCLNYDINTAIPTWFIFDKDVKKIERIILKQKRKRILAIL